MSGIIIIFLQFQIYVRPKCHILTSFVHFVETVTIKKIQKYIPLFYYVKKFFIRHKFY